MKRVLILGAGTMQEPAIDSAHELGYDVVVFDGNSDAYCKHKCEEFYVIDLKCTEEIVSKALELHNKNPISAVFTAGTDFSFAVSSVAKECNIYAHSIEAAKNASDKIIMRTCFEKHGVPSPKFFEIDTSTTKNKIKDFTETLQYPVVVKPCDNMGARGCRLVRDSDELESAIDDAIKYSRTNRAIIEEYMEGPEFSIDALVFNNEITITGFADRHIFYPPYFIEMGHSMPTNIDAKHYKELIETFVQGIRALGLHHGAAKADIKLTHKGPMIGEIAGRLSGGYMSGWTFPYASGLNLTKEALLISLNQEPVLLHAGRKKIFKNVEGFVVYDYCCNKHCVERAWISIPGKVHAVTLGSNEHVQNIFPRLSPGDIATFPENNVQKAGNTICTADTREEAEKHARAFIRNTYLDLDKHSEMTKKFLNQDLRTDFPPSAFILPDTIYDQLLSLPRTPIYEIKHFPDFLHEYADVTDWNGMKLLESLHIVNNYIALHKESLHCNCDSLPDFWHCFIRGGVQGALFYLF